MLARPQREPLVLLPAMLTDARVWDRQRDALACVGRVDALHLVGERSIVAMAERVLDLAPPSFAVGGLSLGGMVAMEVALRAPERVTRLALVGTSARAPTDQQRAFWIGLAESARRDGVRATTRERLLESLRTPGRHDDAAITAEILSLAERVGVEGFRDQLSMQATRVDMRERLHAIACPTLVVRGALDALCSDEMQEEIRQAVQGARYVRVPECGHLATLEEGPAITALLDYWWAPVHTNRPVRTHKSGASGMLGRGELRWSRVRPFGVS
jgi:pimeloyl-ACP methyl ester carboxylesterase